MGHIKFLFLDNGKDVLDSTDIPKIVSAQHFKISFGTTRIEKIEFEGDDIVMEIEIQAIDDFDWDEIPYQSESVRGRVTEIIYYAGISNDFRDIIERIDQVRFEDRFRLSSIGNSAINIIEGTRDSEVFPNITANKSDKIAHIQYAIRNEVRKLEEMSNRESDRKKDFALSDAKRQLKSDIDRFKVILDYFDPNE